MSRGLISYRRLVGSCSKMALDGSIIVEICDETMAKMWRKPVEMQGFFACMLFFFGIFQWYFMHQSIPPSPSAPLPLQGYCRAFARPCQSGWWVFANFALPGGREFANSGAIPKLLTVHAVSYQNITTQKVLLEKKQIGSSVKEWNKMEEGCKSKFSILCMHFIAYQAIITQRKLELSM